MNGTLVQIKSRVEVLIQFVKEISRLKIKTNRKFERKLAPSANYQNADAILLQLIQDNIAREMSLLMSSFKEQFNFH